MATAKRMCRPARWLAGAGVLVLPACAGFAPPERTAEPPAWLGMHANSEAPSRSPGACLKAENTEELAATSPTNFPIAPDAATQGKLGKPLPINLPTALALTNANPLDIRIAEERVRAAQAANARAQVLWLPNVGVGADYNRNEGRIQNEEGQVFNVNKSAVLLGAGPTAVFAVSDALYAPLAARQVVRARQAAAQAARNDTTLSVAEAYFTVQQARGEMAGSIDALQRAEELVKLTQKVAPDLAPTVEVNRAKAEIARRRQAVEAASERWQVASADLTRILRLEPGTLVEPAEDPSLVVELIDPNATPDDLIPLALTNRPELAADQALIQAALARVRQEKVRPFVPTVAVRGTGSQAPGLAGGYYGGGINGTVGDFGGRFSFDLQAVWELQNLGFGNRATIRERESEQRQALLQLLRTHDRVAAEVVQAHAQLRRAANRVRAAADGVADASVTAEKNLLGLVPGKRVGDQLVLVFRPQEAVAAVVALDQAYRDYYGAVGDHNRAQFRLYRALGQPAQALKNVPLRPCALAETSAPVSPPTPVSAAVPSPVAIPEAPSVAVISSSEPAPPIPPPALVEETEWQAVRSGQPTAPVTVDPPGQPPQRP